jgi:geranylgeranyl diphosphate synthase type II
MGNDIVDTDLFEAYLLGHPFTGKPVNLYNAMNYIMQLGGKRMRPKLLLLAYHSIKGELDQEVLKLALAIETFHNFSLVHDDIMDNAPIRRGKKTVHEEWDQSTAILAGDNLLIKAYQLILDTNYACKDQLLKAYTKMSAQVCDGQQMDMNLPKQSQITEAEYLQMIQLKTAVLPAVALQMGALAAGGNEAVCNAFYDFGLHLGMAFQLQDDYLDAFGSAQDIGKQEGGDIIENKRTILLLHALQHLKGADLNQLQNLIDQAPADEAFKISTVRQLMKQAGSDQHLLQLKQAYEITAHQFLDIACPESQQQVGLLRLFEGLKTRVY